MRLARFAGFLFLAAAAWMPGMAASAGAGEAPSGTPAAGTSERVVRTPWAAMRLTRRDAPASFELWIASDTPLDGWVLTRRGQPRPLARGTSNAATRLHVVSPVAWSEDLALTVFLWVDGKTQALKVPMGSSDASGGAGNGVGGDDVEAPWERWEGDPSRPFNRVVEGLFRSAVRDARAGHPQGAREALAKALTLDPTNPKVLDLREHLREASGDGAHRAVLDEARRALKRGDPHAALASLDKLDDAGGEDPEAAALRQKALAATQGDGEKKKRVRKKARVSAAPVEDQDAKARADEAYNLGLESYRKGNWAGAQSFWEQALKNDPNHRASRKALDRLLAEQPGLQGAPKGE